MPSRVTSWRRDKCRAQHPTYDAASRCEIRHIAKEAAQNWRMDLNSIVGRREKQGKSS